jgi:hypothetical protein
MAFLAGVETVVDVGLASTGVLVVDGLIKLLELLDRLGLLVVVVVVVFAAAFVSESSKLITFDDDETIDELDELEIII